MDEQATLPRVPGLSARSGQFHSALYRMCQRNGWDCDAIAAMLARESGFRPGARNPHGTASGLLQIIDSEARKLGTTSARLRRMSATQQLPYIERYFRRAFGDRVPERLVSYYLAGWGVSPWVPDEHVLAARDEAGRLGKYYELNSALDVDHDGVIRAADLGEALRRTLAAAATRPRIVVPKTQKRRGMGVLVALVGGLVLLFRSGARTVR